MSKRLKEAIKLLEKHNYQVIKKGEDIVTRTSVPLTAEEDAYLIKEGGSKWKRGEILKKALKYYKNRENLDKLIDRLLSEVKSMIRSINVISSVPSPPSGIIGGIADLKEKILVVWEEEDQASLDMYRELEFEKLDENDQDEFLALEVKLGKFNAQKHEEFREEFKNELTDKMSEVRKRSEEVNATVDFIRQEQSRYQKKLSEETLIKD